jgi:hypothetical protein
VNDELKRVWKDAVVAYFKVLTQNLPGWTERNHENQCQDIRSPGRDLNPGPAEYEAGVLTTRSRCSTSSLHWRTISQNLFI